LFYDLSAVGVFGGPALKDRRSRIIRPLYLQPHQPPPFVIHIAIRIGQRLTFVVAGTFANRTNDGSEFGRGRGYDSSRVTITRYLYR